MQESITVPRDLTDEYAKAQEYAEALELVTQLRRALQELTNAVQLACASLATPGHPERAAAETTRREGSV